MQMPGKSRRTVTTLIQVTLGSLRAISQIDYSRDQILRSARFVERVARSAASFPGPVRPVCDVPPFWLAADRID
jgi:hypothetical protein